MQISVAVQRQNHTSSGESCPLNGQARVLIIIVIIAIIIIIVVIIVIITIIIVIIVIITIWYQVLQALHLLLELLWMRN